MTLTRTTVLITPELDSGMKLDGTGATALVQPPNRVDFASMYGELTWTIRVLGVTGAPTSWSVSARFQYGVMHAGPTYRFQSPAWHDLAQEQIDTHIVEGVGWYGPGQVPPVAGVAGVLANETTNLASPIYVQRTLRHFPERVRVALTFAVSGGTEPRVRLGMEYTGKGA